MKANIDKIEQNLDSIHDSLISEIKELHTRIEELNAETITKMMDAFADQKQHIDSRFDNLEEKLEEKFDMIHADLHPAVSMEAPLAHNAPQEQIIP